MTWKKKKQLHGELKMTIQHTARGAASRCFSPSHQSQGTHPRGETLRPPWVTHPRHRQGLLSLVLPAQPGGWDEPGSTRDPVLAFSVSPSVSGSLARWSPSACLPALGPLSNPLPCSVGWNERCASDRQNTGATGVTLGLKVRVASASL